jgi:hypothetical protein
VEIVASYTMMPPAIRTIEQQWANEFPEFRKEWDTFILV